MKTDPIIAALVADSETREWPLQRRFAVASVPVALATATLFFYLFGIRDDFFAALLAPRFEFKMFFTALLVLSVWPLLCAAGRPFGMSARMFRTFWFALALFGLALLAELIALSRADWFAHMLGSNALFCLASIPALGLPILVVCLAVLRRAAPADGAWAGMLAGLFAGACAALTYASHCPDDSPLFVAVWYGAAVMALVAAGGGAGRMLLRW